jgi:hypothetical protein
MRQEPHPISDEPGATSSDVFTVADVFICELFGSGESQGLLFLHVLPGSHRCANLVHCVDGIDGCGPRVLERRVNPLNVPRVFFEITAPKRPRALRKTISGGGADRACAAHDHIVNGLCSGMEVRSGDDLKTVGQQALFNQQDGVARGVEGDSAMVLATAAVDDIHACGNLCCGMVNRRIQRTEQSAQRWEMLDGTLSIGTWRRERRNTGRYQVTFTFIRRI